MKVLEFVLIFGCFLTSSIKCGEDESEPIDHVNLGPQTPHIDLESFESEVIDK